jgi:hypothetical protein
VDQVDLLVEQRVHRLVFCNRLLMRLHLLKAVVQPEPRHAESGYRWDVFVHRSGALFAPDLCLFFVGQPRSGLRPIILRLKPGHFGAVALPVFVITDCVALLGFRCLKTGHDYGV